MHILFSFCIFSTINHDLIKMFSFSLQTLLYCLVASTFCIIYYMWCLDNDKYRIIVCFYIWGVLFQILAVYGREKYRKPDLKRCRTLLLGAVCLFILDVLFVDCLDFNVNSLIEVTLECAELRNKNTFCKIGHIRHGPILPTYSSSTL